MNALFLTLLFVGAAFGAVIEKNQVILAEGPACPIDDPLTVEAGPIQIQVGKQDILLQIDAGSRFEGGVATGLSNLKYSYDFNLITLTVKFSAGMAGQVCLNGDKYNAKGRADFRPFRPETLPTGEFEGTGAVHACISDSSASGSAKVRVNLITDRLTIVSITIDSISAAAVDVDLGQVTVAGEPVNWSEWSANFIANFELDWNNSSAEFLARVVAEANYILKDVSLQDLIDLIGGGGDPEPCPARH